MNNCRRTARWRAQLGTRAVGATPNPRFIFGGNPDADLSAAVNSYAAANGQPFGIHVDNA